MTCINRGSFPTRKGSRSPKSREPYCNRHWYSGSSLSLHGFFPFWIFHVFSLCLQLAFFCDLATTTLLFWCVDYSLGITHCTMVDQVKSLTMKGNKRWHQPNLTPHMVKLSNISRALMNTTQTRNHLYPECYHHHLGIPVCLGRGTEVATEYLLLLASMSLDFALNDIVDHIA